jgi:hypothetical protein
LALARAVQDSVTVMVAVTVTVTAVGSEAAVAVQAVPEVLAIA